MVLGQVALNPLYGNGITWNSNKTKKRLAECIFPSLKTGWQISVGLFRRKWYAPELHRLQTDNKHRRYLFLQNFGFKHESVRYLRINGLAF
jgi:hypothetical protein